MSYVDSSLMPGETVKWRTQLHKIMFVVPSILAIGVAIVGFWLFHKGFDAIYTGLSIIIALIILLPACIKYTTSEFAVTNKRVIVKIGFIQRQTMETLLQKIEAISVDQTVLGRILNYGTISIIGTGGTKESFVNIANPLDFRRSIQEQTDAKA